MIITFSLVLFCPKHVHTGACANAALLTYSALPYSLVRKGPKSIFKGTIQLNPFAKSYKNSEFWFVFLNKGDSCYAKNAFFENAYVLISGASL